MDSDAPVTKVDLSSSGLTTLVDQFILPEVEDLDFSHNLIASVPDGFGSGCPRLRRLTLHNNKLERLPETFGRNLNNLWELTLFNNQLKALPPGFGIGIGDDWSPAYI
eukprot:COSAG02_NODE_41081_length_398_cov_1.023411_1_plen_107_part_01